MPKIRVRDWKTLSLTQAKAQVRRLVRHPYARAAGELQAALYVHFKGAWPGEAFAPFVFETAAKANRAELGEFWSQIADVDQFQPHVFAAIHHANRPDLWMRVLAHPLSESVVQPAQAYLSEHPDVVQKLDLVMALHRELEKRNLEYLRQREDALRFTLNHGTLAHGRWVSKWLQQPVNETRESPLRVAYWMGAHPTSYGVSSTAPLALIAHRAARVAPINPAATREHPDFARFRIVLQALLNPKTAKGLRTQAGLDAFVAEMKATQTLHKPARQTVA